MEASGCISNGHKWPVKANEVEEEVSHDFTREKNMKTPKIRCYVCRRISTLDNVIKTIHFKLSL